MPTYEYKCKLCDDRFEVEQSFTDDALTALPGCPQGDGGDHVLKKVFSAVGISFKGEGFYRNDSRPSTKKSTNGSGTGNGSDSTTPTPTKESSGSSTSETSSGSSSTTPAAAATPAPSSTSSSSSASSD